MSGNEEIRKEPMTEEERQRRIEQKTQELQESFSYDNYQIVRKEFFAHQRDASVVIRRDSVTFNQACIDDLEDVVYIQVMVNVQEKRLAIRKCNEYDKGALRWCIVKPNRRVSRKMSGKWFATKLFKDMGWDTNYRYKILGYRITEGEHTLYVFDLSETEMFEDKRNTRKKNAEAAEADKEHAQTEEQLEEAKEERKARRQGHFPEEWENSYGLQVSEQDNYRHVNLKEGYVPLVPEEQKKVPEEQREVELVGE